MPLGCQAVMQQHLRRQRRTQVHGAAHLSAGQVFGTDGSVYLPPVRPLTGSATSLALTLRGIDGAMQRQ